MKTRDLITSLLFLSTGLLLMCVGRASAEGGDSVRVISLSTSGFEQAHSVAYSSDGKFLAVGGTSGIYLFDNLKSSSPDLIETGAWAHSVAFLPGKDILAAGLFDDTVKMWTVPGRQSTRTLPGPQGWVRSIAFSRDGRLLAAASDDNTVRIWNAAQGSNTLRQSVRHD